jgi:hypothetical protein
MISVLHVDRPGRVCLPSSSKWAALFPRQPYR